MIRFVTIFLVLSGIYFILDHRYPLPFNHEQLGLGVNHVGHSIFGVVLIAVAGFIWWRDRKAGKQA